MIRQVEAKLPGAIDEMRYERPHWEVSAFQSMLADWGAYALTDRMAKKNVLSTVDYE